MTAIKRTLPKAFAVWFKDLHRWDYGFFNKVSWQWPEHIMQPIGRVLIRKKAEVNKKGGLSEIPIIKKISFGGEITLTEVDERKKYKGRLFWANKGDLIYSKIRVKQGSMAIVPDSIETIAVSNEYPVYQINSEVINSTYLALVLKSRAFLNLLEGLSHGGSTKTRIPPERFETQKIPIPSLPTQEFIVKQWRLAQEEIKAAYNRVEQCKMEIEAAFFYDLGFEFPEIKERPKVLAVLWNDFRRWSVSYNQAAQCGADITQGHYPVVALDSILEVVQYGTSKKANSTGDGIPVIRMNNIVEGSLDLSKLKHVKLTEKERDSLLLKDGDILFNRTNSKELVGKCAVFHGEEEYVFASYLIRVKVDTGQANPDFVAYAINSRMGRQQIDALSRQIIGQANVNSEELRELSIPLPLPDIQDKIIGRVEEGQLEIARERAIAEQKAREVKDEIEALILGTKSIEDSELAA